MDPRLLSGSSSKVFLTETKATIQYPVDARQHGLDENPEFEKFLRNQQTSVTALHSTGVTIDSARPIQLYIGKKEKQRSSIGESELLMLNEQARKAEMTQREEEWRATAETEREELKARQIRHWNKMHSKITFKEPGKDYYSQTPLKPGVWFWKYLLTNKVIPPSRLQVQIPETLTVFEDLHWAYTDPSTDRLIVTDEFSIGSVYKSFEKFKDGMNPCAVLRIPIEPISEMKALLLNWFDLGDKVLKSQLPDVGIIQRLVRCHGARPTVVRLFFIAETKRNKATYAYSISNTDAAMRNYYNGKFVVCSDHYDGIEITPQYGAALKAVSDTGAKVVDYLQLAYYVRFEEIVLDFVRDECNRVWLLGCKGFRIDMAVQRLREIRDKEETGKSGTQVVTLREEKMQEQLTAVHCKLCQLQYKAFEMKHRLPFKVLLIYKQHVYRSERKLLDLSHLRVNSPDFLSHWVSVCDICYMLLVHEYELLETEMKLAALLNVPVKHPQVLGSFKYEQPNFMPDDMHQWRILFYFQRMESVDFQGKRQKVYIQYEFLSGMYSYKMKLKWEGEESTLNVSRLYYFFAVRDAGVVHFCRDTLIRFRMTKSKKWADVVAEGECRPLCLFSTQLPDSSSVVQSFEVLMFDESAIVSKIHLKVGFACDKPVHVKELPVTITRIGSIYIPEPSFFTSDSLPDAWMEAFEPEYREEVESKVMDSTMELEEMYTPVIGKLAPRASPPLPRKTLFSPSFRPSSARLSPKFSIPLLTSLDSSPFPQKSTEVSTKRRTFETAATSRVLYSPDSISKIASPTFLSPRYGKTAGEAIPMREESIAGESMEDLRELIGEVKTEGDEVATTKDIIKRFIRKKTKSKEKLARRKTKRTAPGSAPLKSIRSFQNFDLRQAKNSLKLVQTLNQNSTASSLRRYLVDLTPFTSLSPTTVKTARV